MLIDLSIKEFSRAVAAHEPVLPAGGCVIAVSGLLGVSLVEMAVNSARSQAGGGESSHLEDIHTQLTAWHAELARCVDQDAAAYSGLLAAYKLPRTTAAETEHRRQDIHTAALHSIEAPLNIAATCLAAAESGITLLPQTKPGVAGDLKIGLLTLRTCITGALTAAKINLPLIRDQQLQADFAARVEWLQRQFDALD